MVKWVTRVLQGDTVNALTKARGDFAKIAHEMGYQYLDILRYNRGKETYGELGARIEGITNGVRKGDLLVYQYPTYIGAQFEVSFLEHTIYRGINVVLMVHDYDSLRFSTGVAYNEIRHLNLASLLIVPNEEMLKKMRADGVNTPAVLQNSWDYLTDTPFKEGLPKREVTVAGSFVKSDIISTWKNDTPLVAYGQNDKNLKIADKVDYRGTVSSDKLDEMLPNSFGIAWDTVEPYHTYTKYNNPYKIAAYLALGMPVIVWKESAIAKLVLDNNLGIAVNSLDEIDILLNAITDEELADLQQRVRAFGNLIRDGYFTRRALVNVEQKLLNPYLEVNPVSADENEAAMVKVLDITETLDLIKETHASVIRLGDGEINLIDGKGITYQQYDEKLSKKLKEIADTKSSDRLLICLPDIFTNLKRYTKTAMAFWNPHRNVRRGVYEQLPKDNLYGSTFISRPYIDLIDKRPSAKYFNDLKDLWFQRDILIVEGDKTRSGVGNDLFEHASSIERIIAPSKDAYSKVSEIETAIKKYGQNKLVLLMLGPTAKVVVSDLYAEESMWLIDLGHIDSEYEWFQMGVHKKTKLKNKHTAEFNNDVNIDFDEDPIYESQIIADLSE